MSARDSCRRTSDAIRKEHEAQSTGYAKVPVVALRDLALSHGALRLFALLVLWGRSTGVVDTLQQSLADALGITTKQVGRLVKELVSHGYIAPPTRADFGQGYRYVLLPQFGLADRNVSSEQQGLAVQEPQALAGLDEQDVADEVQATSKKQGKEKKNPDTPSPAPVPGGGAKLPSSVQAAALARHLFTSRPEMAGGTLPTALGPLVTCLSAWLDVGIPATDIETAMDCFLASQEVDYIAYLLPSLPGTWERPRLSVAHAFLDWARTGSASGGSWSATLTYFTDRHTRHANSDPASAAIAFAADCFRTSRAAHHADLKVRLALLGLQRVVSGEAEPIVKPAQWWRTSDFAEWVFDAVLSWEAETSDLRDAACLLDLLGHELVAVCSARDLALRRSQADRRVRETQAVQVLVNNYWTLNKRPKPSTVPP